MQYYIALNNNNNDDDNDNNMFNHDLLYTFFCTQIYAISMVFACYKYLKERMRLSQLGRCYTDNNGDAEVTFSYCAELLNGHLLHAFGNLVIF